MSVIFNEDKEFPARDYKPYIPYAYDYIASPYSHPLALIREERYLHVSYYLKQCLEKREWAYSPIVHCHELAKTWDLPKDAGFWEEYNFVMLRNATRMKILRLEGWEESVGIRAELAEAQRIHLPVIYV